MWPKNRTVLLRTGVVWERLHQTYVFSPPPPPLQLILGGSKFVFSVLGAIFIGVTIATCDVIGFFLLRWLVNSYHPFDRSDVKWKPTVCWSLTFSRAPDLLLVFVLISHWLIYICSYLSLRMYFGWALSIKNCNRNSQRIVDNLISISLRCPFCLFFWQDVRWGDMALNVCSFAHALTHLFVMLLLDSASVRAGGLVAIVIRVGSSVYHDWIAIPFAAAH